VSWKSAIVAGSNPTDPSQCLVRIFLEVVARPAIFVLVVTIF
jgi:hypothetical protein